MGSVCREERESLLTRSGRVEQTGGDTGGSEQCRSGPGDEAGARSKPIRYSKLEQDVRDVHGNDGRVKVAVGIL
jgi:hypothetical protein